MARIVKNDLARFLSKIDKIKKESPKYGAEIVGKNGVEIARKYYGMTADMDTGTLADKISITSESKDDGSGKITATGVGLVYFEYGTGELGKASNYPSQKLNFKVPTFYSKKLGKNVSLAKWTYSYANSINKNIPTIKGHKAYAQMFNTAQELKRIFKAKRSD